MRILSLFGVCLVHGGAIAAIVKVGQQPVEKPPVLLMQASLLQGAAAEPEPEVQAKPLPQKKQSVKDKPKQTMLASKPAAAPSDEAPIIIADNSPPPEGDESDKDAGSIERPLDANYRHNPAPSYPMISRRLNEHGRVILKVHVAEDGSALEVLLQTSSGFERLDQAALRAVVNWQFEPAQRGGTAVTSWVLVPIVFNLRG